MGIFCACMPTIPRHFPRVFGSVTSDNDNWTPETWPSYKGSSKRTQTSTLSGIGVTRTIDTNVQARDDEMELVTFASTKREIVGSMGHSCCSNTNEKDAYYPA